MKTYTTKGLQLGFPEAEAEKSFLSECFKDFFGIEKAVKNGGRFIITGRKGSGKSAYAVWLQNSAENNEHLFFSLVKKSDFYIESEIIKWNDEMHYEALFEWIILVRIVKLIIDSNIGTYIDQVVALHDFYDKNAGYASIDKYNIVEIINNQEINFTPLKKDFGFFSKFKGRKEVKAPFIQMITPLRESIAQVLQMDVFQGIDLYVAFDDLDLKFKASRYKDREMLMDLLRVAKNYNTEFFYKTGAKVLVFLRDDIADKLSGVDADSNKLFTSYEHTINWYEHDKAIENENQVLLRKFINIRLRRAFARAQIPFDSNDPWLSFVEERKGEYRSSFKYILEHTFFLPRDILLIFKSISQKNLRLPLSHLDINALLREYAKYKYREIRDELYAVFESEGEVDAVFRVLLQVGYDDSMSYEDVLSELEENGLPNNTFDILLDYSLLVPRDEHGHLFFNYREQAITDGFDNYEYTLPRILKVYYRQI